MAVNELPSAPHFERKLTDVLSFGCLLAFAVAPAFAVFDGVSSQARLAVIHVALTLMLVPEIVSEVVQGTGELSAALVGLSSLVFLVLLTSILSHRFPLFQKLVESEPTILISNGRLMTQQMNAERIVPEELMSEMHKQGLEALADVKWAILESSGNITFIPRSQALPHGSTGDTNRE